MLEAEMADINASFSKSGGSGCTAGGSLQGGGTGAAGGGGHTANVTQPGAGNSTPEGGAEAKAIAAVAQATKEYDLAKNEVQRLTEVRWRERGLRDGIFSIV